MRATVIMVIAMFLYVIHRWATGKTAVSVQIVLSGAFVLFIIALLDRGRTEPVAQGFAWLFLLIAFYNAIPALTGIMKTASAPGGTAVA
jgi:hypothetical protein